MRSRPCVAGTARRVLAGCALIDTPLVIECSSNNSGSNGASVSSSLIVSDSHQNRVLIYDAPSSTGQSASVVLGQAAFTTETSGATANTMTLPGAITMDNAGNLYVADEVNCRVIQFRPPFSNGMSASLVLGQPNLNSAVCPTNASAQSLGKSIPLGNGVFGISIVNVVLDSAGGLWAADSDNHRVLEYKPPLTDGMAAVLAIGQVDLGSDIPNQGGANPTSISLLAPIGLAFDRSGNLWVVDHGNSRVLEFRPPFATGMAASLVLGQVDFTHGSPNQGGSIGANTLNEPSGATFDSTGDLWVVDELNHRVLEFEPPFSTNMSASLVVGQVDFTRGLANQGIQPGAALTSATLNNSHGVTFDSSGRLFVSDSQNNRILAFVPPFSNGIDASLVIGQTDFTTHVAATTASGVNFPFGVIAAPAH